MEETYTYGAGGERISMAYLPAYDDNNGRDPTSTAGGARLDTMPKTVFYRVTGIIKIPFWAEKILHVAPMIFGKGNYSSKQQHWLPYLECRG